MNDQFGWVIKWATVGISNGIDRKDGPYGTASHIGFGQAVLPSRIQYRKPTILDKY